MKPVKTIFSLIKETLVGFGRDKGPLLSAALAYYTVFSLAPLGVITVSVAGSVFGKAAVEGRLVGQIEQIVGEEIAVFIQLIIQNASQFQSRGVVTVVSVVVLLLGASRVFVQLKSALNIIWRIELHPGQGFLHQVKVFLISIGMVLLLGVFFSIILSARAVISAVGPQFSQVLGGLAPIYTAVEITLSMALITLIFALIFKVLPDADVAWKDIWMGAFVTALLFTLGEYLIGQYLRWSSVGSAYGVAGSLIVFLLWIYYSAQILLLGAEFTKVYANLHGSRLLPSENAVLLSVPGQSDRADGG